MKTEIEYINSPEQTLKDLKIFESEKEENDYKRTISICLSIYIVAMVQTYYFFPDLLPRITASLLVVVSLGITVIMGRKKTEQHTL